MSDFHKLWLFFYNSKNVGFFELLKKPKGDKVCLPFPRKKRILKLLASLNKGKE